MKTSIKMKKIILLVLLQSLKAQLCCLARGKGREADYGWRYYRADAAGWR